ncbi:zinc finger BED domain-containing protein 1-like [Rhizophagus clarus]|uniref:Zinc finger BED domain-containing protein 1-like n=1 Tax=Rhizophagus clarus TaxID=94130 RepID=A0A8H3MAD7_9GLOM|nr:zinc finger BED domain-containing protein 1-like [Rhizophagus clarus]
MLLVSVLYQYGIGITCAYIDNQFKLNEAILAIKYVPYSHTGEATAEEIMSILNEWKLTDKVFTITTDNGRNMVKSARLIPGLIRIPYTAHTLQLDIINIMITELCIDSDKQAKKDGKRLKDINLTKDEWNAISVKLSNSNINEVDAVDFTEPSTAFDDDDEYEDSEDGDIANNQSKQHKEKEYHEEYLTNSLLASMFSRKYECGDEVTEYLRVGEIGFSENSCTSTPSERLLSDAGNLMTVRRTSLSPSTFEHLFLKRNWDLVGSIFAEK